MTNRFIVRFCTDSLQYYIYDKYGKMPKCGVFPNKDSADEYCLWLNIWVIK